mmetsp:Transcript_683/g.1368  ORF Transcript_683/g.1368 Transcript_683/m.1368 type:complete len:235 (-) Transcript_683:771-1475(-)
MNVTSLTCRISCAMPHCVRQIAAKRRSPGALALHETSTAFVPAMGSQRIPAAFPPGPVRPNARFGYRQQCPGCPRASTMRRICGLRSPCVSPNSSSRSARQTALRNVSGSSPRKRFLTSRCKPSRRPSCSLKSRSWSMHRLRPRPVSGGRWSMMPGSARRKRGPRGSGRRRRTSCRSTPSASKPRSNAGRGRRTPCSSGSKMTCGWSKRTPPAGAAKSRQGCSASSTTTRSSCR